MAYFANYSFAQADIAYERKSIAWGVDINDKHYKQQLYANRRSFFRAGYRNSCPAINHRSQNRIRIAEQKKLQLEWKQDYYREILTKLTSFNNKYFGSSPSSLFLGDSLKQLSAASSHPQYVTAVGGSNSLPQNVFISDIQSLAASAKIQGTNTVSAP